MPELRGLQQLAEPQSSLAWKYVTYDGKSPTHLNPVE